MKNKKIPTTTMIKTVDTIRGRGHVSSILHSFQYPRFNIPDRFVMLLQICLKNTTLKQSIRFEDEDMEE